MNLETNSSYKITKDMVIGEILGSFPEKAFLLSQALMDFGIHCVGCHASSFESLEEGLLMHGYSDEEIDKLVSDLNEIVSSGEMNEDKKDFFLNMSSRAISKVKELIDENDEGEILRVSVVAGGCSGFSYDLEIVREKFIGDYEHEVDGLIIAVDRDSMEYLNGVKIDYVDTLNDAGFKFENPNSTKACGCGKSFS